MSPTLLDAWKQTLRASPDAPALIDAATNRTWSRAEIDASASEWHAAHGKTLRGLTVVFAEQNGAEWLRVFLGILKADGIAVALDPGEPVAAQRATATAIRAARWWHAGELHELSARSRPARDGRRIVKLTSGSTGTPRVLGFTDAQMLADGRQVCASMGIMSRDLNLGLIPFGHSYGLGNLVMPLLAQGTAIVSGVAPLPHVIAAAIERWRPTVFPAVPAMLRALADSDIPAGQLSSLRTIISAGAPLAPEIAGAFDAKFGKTIHSFYGSSETGGITYDRTGEAARTGRSVGTPLAGVRLAFDRRGRFFVESAAVFTIGNRASRGAAVGRYRPADLAELNAAGELVLRGRAGRMVKIGGRRLNLAEVEHALKQVPGVRDALVVAQTERAETLAAAVATDRGAAEVRETLRTRLAPWKIPKKILVLPAFPLNARGKTDAVQLRTMLGAR